MNQEDTNKKSKSKKQKKSTAPRKASAKNKDKVSKNTASKAAKSPKKSAVTKKKTITKAKKVKAKAKEAKVPTTLPAVKNPVVKTSDTTHIVATKTKTTSLNTSTNLLAKGVILQVLPELKSGGVERGTIEIARAGQKLGYKMLVASNGGHLLNQLLDAGATHIKLPLASKNPFTIISNIFALKKAIKNNNVDIVHARSRAPAWSAYYASKNLACHFITTFHGTYSFGNKLKKFYNSVMTKGERVIAISNFIRDHIIENYEVDPKKITVIPRGVDLQLFTKENVHKIRVINMASKFKIELDVPVILLPARFTRWKGHEFLLEALALIKDEKFVCIFAGYDEKHKNYYHDLQRKVKDCGLFHKVRMIGEIKDMPALYNLSDIVVSASLRPEAFGRVAIEAQAMERLVVATNHGGSVETISPGENGWLVNVGDTAELAKLLKELLEISSKNRKTVTTKARKNIVHNFSMDNMIQKTFNVYDNILAAK